MKMLVLGMLAAALGLAAAEMEVSGSRVNIRKSPSVKAAVVGALKAGDRVQVKQVKNGWAELESRPGFVSATYLRTPGGTAKSAPETEGSAAAKPAPEKAAKAPAGPVFPDLPVEPGSGRDVTVTGKLFPIKPKAHIRYALLKVVDNRYEIDYFVYVPDSEAAKFKQFADKDVQLVGTRYKVADWKNPVLKVRRIKPR